MIRIIFCIAVLFSFISTAQSQELNCTVNIEFSKTQTADIKIFQNLEASIAEFMNSRKWTNDSYQPHEKIDCSILINIDQELSPTEFAGQFIIQSERPVFNSTYQTVVYSYKDDKFQFEYNEFGNLEFSDNTYLSNLTSFLAYYAYLIIGYDYETFSPEGGTPYFLKAQDVINSIPSNQKAKYDGWSTFGNTKNRAIVLENILNPRYKIYRDVLFKIHFNGFDKMHEDVQKARKVITENLFALEAIHEENPSSLLLKVFFLAKSDEIISLYSAAPSSERNKVIDLMSDMDPVNASRYKEIGK